MRGHPVFAIGFVLCVLTLFPVNALSDQAQNLPRTVFCESLPAPITGSCTVTSGNRALLLKGTVLTFDAIFEGGEVLVDQSGLIRYVGCSAGRPAQLSALASSATKIECEKGVISPGLVNTHDHLAFDHNSPFPATDVRYSHRNDWRPGGAGLEDDSQSKMAWSELRQIITGTTAITGSSGVVGFIRNLDIHGFPASDDLLWNTFAGQPPEIITSDTFPLEHPRDLLIRA